MIGPLLLYVVVGIVLTVVLTGLTGPTVGSAFRRDLRSLRERGFLTAVTGGAAWFAVAVASWPVVAACEAITWWEEPVAASA
jgi:hypothetical protein